MSHSLLVLGRSVVVTNRLDLLLRTILRMPAVLGDGSKPVGAAVADAGQPNESTTLGPDPSEPEAEGSLEPELDSDLSGEAPSFAMRRLRGSAKKNRDAGTPPPPIDAGAPPTTDAGTPPPTGGVGADGVWTPLSVIQVLNPMNCGAVGNGTTDDLAALNTTVNALPVNGGIVYFPTGKVFRKTNILLIGKSYVKLWATNRDAEIFSTIGGQYRHQSVLCRSTTGCGVFGLKLRSDATSRFDALEDHHISMDRTTLSEIVGNEIQSSAAAGVFLPARTKTTWKGTTSTIRGPTRSTTRMARQHPGLGTTTC